MPGDVQLTALQTAAAPLDYIVPGSAVIRVKSVRGEFADNGAGGDWLPAVQLISDSGHIIATASAQSAKVTAGGSADASFFPGGGETAAPTSASGLAVASLRATAATSIPGDNAIHYVSLQNGSNCVFATTDATVFNNSSTTLFTGSPLYGVGVLVPGTFRYEFNCFASNGTAGRFLTTYWSSSGSALLSDLQQGRTAVTENDTWDANTQQHVFWTEWQSFLNSASVPGVAVPYAKVSGGASVTVKFSLIVTQVTPTPLADL